MQLIDTGKIFSYNEHLPQVVRRKKFLNITVVKFLNLFKLKVYELFPPLWRHESDMALAVDLGRGLGVDLGLVAAFYFRNTIIALPVLKLTNQNKRHYLFRFESVNQLVAFLTSVALNWQRHSAKADSLKKIAKIPQTFWVFGLNELRYI